MERTEKSAIPDLPSSGKYFKVENKSFIYLDVVFRNEPINNHKRSFFSKDLTSNNLFLLMRKDKTIRLSKEKVNLQTSLEF